MHHLKKTSFILLSWIIVLAVALVDTSDALESISGSIWAPQPLARIIEEGLANNREIQSLESKIAALKQEIAFAGSLSDPKIGFSLMNLPTDTFRFDQEPMTQKQFFIAQKVPWFGKLSLKSKKAAVKAIRQEAILSAKKLSLARQIAVTYYQLGFVVSSEKINERLQQMVTQLLRVSETRYAVGRGLQQDVLQAQVELSKLLDEKIMLAKNRRTLEDRINELLNRERFLPVNPPKGLPYLDMHLEVEDLKALAMTMNPGLDIRRAEIDLARIDVQLSEKDYMPDMEFKLVYGQRDDGSNGQKRNDFVSTSVVMNIPLWHKSRQDKKLAATQNLYRAAVHSYQNLERALPHKIDALANEIRNTQENYKLFTDALIVQASQWAQASLSAYEVGKLEFNSMITAQIRLLRFELRAENYLFNLYKKRAELEETVGRAVPEKDVEATPSHTPEKEQNTK